MDVLRQHGHDVSLDGNHLIVEGHDHPDQLTRALAERGLYVSELTEIRPTLESVFLRLTRRSATQPPATSEAS
jgi:ABC-2 type transport system ATP-binding protein